MAGLKFNPNAGHIPPKPPVQSTHQAAHLNQQNLAQAGVRNQVQSGKAPNRNTPNEPGALPRKSDGRGKPQLSGGLANTLQNLTITRRGGKGGKGGDAGGGGLHGGSSQALSKTRTSGTQGAGPVKYRAVSTSSSLAQRRIQHTSHDVAMPPTHAGPGKTSKARAPGITDFADRWMPPSGAMAAKSRVPGFSFLKGGLALRSGFVHRFAGRAMHACGDFFARMLSPTPEQKQIQGNMDRKIQMRRSVEATAVKEQNLERTAEKQSLDRRYQETVSAEGRRTVEEAHIDKKFPGGSPSQAERDVHPQFAQHAHTTPGHSFKPGTMPHQAILQAP